MIDSGTLATALISAGSGRVAMVHSDIRGCLRFEGTTITEKLETIRAGLVSVVDVLVMPTFTYSFGRGADFSVEDSPSTVGALTEYFRKLPETHRTYDPMFSCAVQGILPPIWERKLFSVHDVNCFGAESIFAYLDAINATFILFGVGIEACTFVHYIEQCLNVPYRYTKEFSGKCNSVPVQASYFVRPLNGSVEYDWRILESSLLEEGRAHEAVLPGGPRLLVTNARSIKEAVRDGLSRDPNFLLQR